jgi:hypothetical protein
MQDPQWELAQLNIGTIVAPLDSEELSGFVRALAPIKTLVDAAPGFMWRLQDETGDATSFRAFGDDRGMVNMSVWSLEALGDFVYRSAHVEMYAFTVREPFPPPGAPAASAAVSDDWLCPA